MIREATVGERVKVDLLGLRAPNGSFLSDEGAIGTVTSVVSGIIVVLLDLEGFGPLEVFVSRTRIVAVC